MADYKYCNPGYIGLFDTYEKTGDQITNNYTYNPICGVCLKSQLNVNFKQKIEPSLEYWLKVQMYIAESRWPKISLLSNSHNIAIYTNAEYDKSTDFAISSDSASLSNSIINVAKNVPITFELHVKSDSTNGLVEVYMNNLLKISYTGNVLNGETINYFKIINNGAWYGATPIFYSDIICQNTGRIGFEHCTALPVKATTGWTANTDGSYYTESEGDKLLQTIDIDTLKTQLKYSNYLTIKSISTSGTLAYYNADGYLNGVTTIIKNSTTEKEADTNVLNTTTADMFTSTPILINPITNAAWNVNDLSDLQIGVKSVKVSG
jgi:hypothetical protein